MKSPETARRLKIAMDNMGINALDLSIKSGVSQPSISQYVTGTHAPSNISASKIAKVLNVSPVWLMGFDVDMYVNWNPKTQEIDTKSEYDYLVEFYKQSDDLTKEMVKRLLKYDEKMKDIKGF